MTWWGWAFFLFEAALGVAALLVVHPFVGGIIGATVAFSAAGMILWRKRRG